MWDDPAHVAAFCQWLDDWITAGGDWSYVYTLPTGLHFAYDITPASEWAFLEPAIDNAGRLTFLGIFRARWP